MISELILTTVLVPFVLGMAMFVVLRVFPKFDPLSALIAGALVFAVFVMLEGWPSLPPASSKPKVAVLMVGFTILSVVAAGLRLNRFVAISAMLVAATAWIGWNRIDDIEMLPRFASLLVPILVGSWAFQKFENQDAAGLAWPVTLICFGIGGALIALLGAYIGFAQMMGALAALIGGFALLAYLVLLFRPEMVKLILPRSALQSLFLGMMAVMIAVALFAPEVSPIAIAILGLSLFTPSLRHRVEGMSTALQPILIGVIAAVPVGVAIVFAAL